MNIIELNTHVTRALDSAQNDPEQVLRWLQSNDLDLRMRGKFAFINSGIDPSVIPIWLRAHRPIGQRVHLWRLG